MHSNYPVGAVVSSTHGRPLCLFSLLHCSFQTFARIFRSSTFMVGPLGAVWCRSLAAAKGVPRRVARLLRATSSCLLLLLLLLLHRWVVFL